MADGTHPVVVLDIDGLKRELFYNLLADGRLPAFGRLLGRGAWVRHATTVVPSETLPAQTSLFTGLAVRRHGIVGNGWLNRTADPPDLVDFSNPETAALVYGYGLFGLPTVLLPKKDDTGLVNSALYPGAKTLYQRAASAGLRSTVVFNQISRGATQWIRPSRPEMMYVAVGSRARLDYALIDRKTWSATEKELKSNGLPDLLTLYFCGLDAWGHHTAGEGQDVYLERVLEPVMDSLARLFEARGWLDTARFVLCSDHGHSWLGRKGRIPTAALARALESCGRTPAAHAPLAPAASAYYSIIGGCAQIHLRNQATGRWADAPDMERDLLPAARAIAALGAPPPQAPLHTPPERYFNLILIRPAPGAEYQVFRDGALISPERYFWNRLDATPLALQNIHGLNCARSGDIVLFTNFESGYYFADEDVPRSHGSLAADDMGIPLIFSGPGIPHSLLERASILDVTPTILSLFGIDPFGCDGRALPVLDKE